VEEKREKGLSPRKGEGEKGEKRLPGAEATGQQKTPARVSFKKPAQGRGCVLSMKKETLESPLQYPRGVKRGESQRESPRLVVYGKGRIKPQKRGSVSTHPPCEGENGGWEARDLPTNPSKKKGGPMLTGSTELVLAESEKPRVRRHGRGGGKKGRFVRP